MPTSSPFHSRLACLALVLVLFAVGCASATPPCYPGYHKCCNLGARGFNSDDARSIEWLRRQIDTPEFYPPVCHRLHQFTFDTIGRKMCDVGCWGYPVEIDGGVYEAPTLIQVIDLLRRRSCKNNFAAGGYWC